MKIIFKKIYIFDLKTKKAYFTEFEEGLNVITSSEKNGNERGKSLLLRSLYHTLGADCYFSKKWDQKSKVYILFLEVDGKGYVIFRSEKLFKIFNEKIELMYKCNNRWELANTLEKIFNFSIWIPNRKENKLNIAPPAYSYLINFIDQDWYKGSYFKSFKNLEQFENFKLSVIYSHLGIYNKKYFERIKEKEKIEDNIKEIKYEIEFRTKMKKELESDLVNYSCPENYEELKNEILLESQTYSSLISEMSKIRNKIIDLKNQLIQQKMIIGQITENVKSTEKDINNIWKTNKCIECNSLLNNKFKILSKKYNYIDNIHFMKNILDNENLDIKRDLEKYRTKYLNFVEQLNEYDKKISKNEIEIKEYFKFREINNLVNNLKKDLISLPREIENLNIKLNKLKEINDVKDKIKSIDIAYKTLISKLKSKFKLEELGDDNFDRISKNFSGSGSRVPLVTLIWYFTINDLKQKFNPNGAMFPMVLDSPNNAETDEDKKKEIFKYIIESSKKFDQLIFSTIGFSEDDYNIETNVNIKVLKNEKYKLLDKD
ncbi:hypothetical protein PR068_03530, partial [Metamycoplasma hyosynoviae]